MIFSNPECNTGSNTANSWSQCYHQQSIFHLNLHWNNIAETTIRNVISDCMAENLVLQYRRDLVSWILHCCYTSCHMFHLHLSMREKRIIMELCTKYINCVPSDFKLLCRLLKSISLLIYSQLLHCKWWQKDIRIMNRHFRNQIRLKSSIFFFVLKK